VVLRYAKLIYYRTYRIVLHLQQTIDRVVKLTKTLKYAFIRVKVALCNNNLGHATSDILQFSIICVEYEIAPFCCICHLYLITLTWFSLSSVLTLSCFLFLSVVSVTCIWLHWHDFLCPVYLLCPVSCFFLLYLSLVFDYIGMIFFVQCTYFVLFLVPFCFLWRAALFFFLCSVCCFILFLYCFPING
jgi:hypothetical protein